MANVVTFIVFEAVISEFRFLVMSMSVSSMAIVVLQNALLGKLKRYFVFLMHTVIWRFISFCNALPCIVLYSL